MDNSVFTKTVREKKKIARTMCKEKEKKWELCEQIEVCEALMIPLTEEHIVRLALMPLRKMRNELSRHKGMV